MQCQTELKKSKEIILGEEEIDMKKAPQTGIRVSVDTLSKIKVMAAADNRSITNYIETLIDMEYKKMNDEKIKTKDIL